MLPVKLQLAKPVSLPFRAAFSLLLLSFLTVSACAEAPKREAETYLIEKDYVGPVYVVFGVSKGESGSRQNDIRIYRIPESGILLTQMSLNEGRISPSNLRFFQVSESGEREEIQNYLIRLPDEKQDLEEGTTYVVGGGIGNISALPNLDCTIHYVSYHVGSPQELFSHEDEINLIEHLRDNGITCDDIEKQETFH